MHDTEFIKDRMIEAYGVHNSRQLKQKMGITPANITNWRSRGVPVHRIKQAVKETGQPYEFFVGKGPFLKPDEIYYILNPHLQRLALANQAIAAGVMDENAVEGFKTILGDLLSAWGKVKEGIEL